MDQVSELPEITSGQQVSELGQVTYTHTATGAMLIGRRTYRRGGA